VKAKVVGPLKQMRQRARLEAGSHLRRAGELVKRYAYERRGGSSQKLVEPQNKARRVRRKFINRNLI